MPGTLRVPDPAPRRRVFTTVIPGLILALLWAGVLRADGTLSTDKRIHSDALGYALQYRVYTPPGSDRGTEYPVLFLTDGPEFIRQGRVIEVLDRLIGAGRIRPLIAVFVDPRDPDHPQSNRRFREYLCNAAYLAFYTGELIPAVERDYPAARDRGGRAIMGYSYGATNAACFGLLGYQYFSGIAMLSPANHPLPGMLPAWRKAPRLPLTIFLSTGKPDDNTSATREFRDLLREKAYPMKYLEVRKGHDWSNWRSLVDDVLLYFYAPAGAAGD